MELKDLNKSIESISQSFTELKAEQDKNRTADEAKLAKLAEDIGSKVEALQAEQVKLQAVIERVGVETEAKADDSIEVKALRKYLKNGEKGLDADEQKALATFSNPDGGYFVNPEMGGVINGRVFETSAMRAIATVRTTANKSVVFGMDDNECAGGWAGEAETNGETDTPQVGEIEIPAHKLEARPRVTSEMLDDAGFNVEAWLSGKVADKFARLENTAFVAGDGIKRPRGFLTYTAGTQGADYVRGSIEQIANGSTTAVTENGLIDLIGSLKEEYQANGSLVMKRSTFVNIMKLAGSNTFRFLNLQPMGPAGQTGGIIKPVMTLMDKPVYLMNDMPAIASNALSIAYGDFRRGYTIVDRLGISMQRDPYTVKPRVEFYTTKRTGGAVTNYEALKLLKMA